MFLSDAFILKGSKENNLKVSNFLIFFYGIIKKNLMKRCCWKIWEGKIQSQSAGIMLSSFAFAPASNQTGICWDLTLPDPRHFTVKGIPDVGNSK